MQKINYDFLMKEQLKDIPKGEKILLHSCCAPCSTTSIERLAQDYDITIFFYNCNITRKDEYEKRFNAVKELVSKLSSLYGKIEVVDGNYNPEVWLKMCKGLEHEKERGKRCYLCYKLRLDECAKFARKEGYKYFATTLTLSPYKKTDWINQIGEELDKEYGVTYIYSDFKKNNGYKRSIELSDEYNLYRQNYCGCAFSLRDRMLQDREKGLISF